MTALVDRTGDRYGRLIVISRCENNSRGQAIWKCLCDCGNYKTILGNDLHRGSTKSCGCFSSELLSSGANHRKHGLSGTSEHNTWLNIKSRCYKENNPAYHNYGGRGIKVCDRWLESFENFYADMGKKPSKNHSIDRSDNDKGYSPDNCVWATRKEQMNNVRYNRLITLNGVTKTVSEMAEYFNIKLSIVQTRLARNWSDEDAFKKEVAKSKRLITVDGITKTVTEMSNMYNIDRSLVTGRLGRGWSHEKAIKTAPDKRFNKLK